MRPIQVKVNLNNSSATKVAASQTPSVAGNLTLTAAASAIDTSGAARILLLTTAADETARTFVITGKDADGNAVTENLTGVNNTTAVSVKQYASVSTIHVDAGTAGAITFGTTNTTLSAQSATTPLDFYHRIAAMVSVEVTGTINFTVQETMDPILANGTAGEVLYSVTNLATKTTSTRSQISVGATGVLVVINSYSSGATLTMNIISPSDSFNG